MMDKSSAIRIIQNTFESPFDKGRFINLSKNLVNYLDASKNFTYQGNYIPDAYENSIQSLERIGKYEDAEDNKVDVLIVRLKKEQSLERARTMQRNFVAWYLNGSRGGELKDAALVAFVSPENEGWRFSLVKMDYNIAETPTGKIKVEKELTPARRYSFLVGENEKSHTAQTQFVPLLENDEDKPTLARLEEAFNIEKVTKEFFIKYRDLFIRTKQELDSVVQSDPLIKADFESKSINTVDFAKKLLGQIIFLYFLQKKGWFGVPKDAEWGSGSKQFLRELFEKKHGEYNNFFNDILEPLFYEALRMDRSHDDNYYSRFNCKIPFLNGGLFDPMNNYDWVKTDIRLPDKLFSNTRKTKEGDTGDGILDVFDRYNFTVREDEPFEKEVAIDPEMLGKAYEKFNAIRPDNFDEFLKALKSGKKGEESKFNRQYGVYYTPREIVHYMCQQSLINYLYSELNPVVIYQRLGDDQLDMLGNTAKGGQMDLNVEHRPMAKFPKEDLTLFIKHGDSLREHEARVDAAGKETDTYSYKLPESIRRNVVLIDEKLASIKICDPAVGSGAFPVGMMSEIVKARQTLDVFTKTGKTVYDYKRECIENSLYGVDIDAGAVEIAKLRLWLSLIVDEDDIQNIKPLPNLDYKIVCGNSLVGFPENWGSSIEKEIESLIHQHFNETNPTKKDQLKKQIDEKIETHYENSIKVFGFQVNFDFRTVFSEVFQRNGGFDVVIANPPYDVYEGNKKEEIQTIKKMPIYNISEGGKLNAYKLFLAKSIRLQKPSGILCEIFQNSFLADTSATKLRKHFLEHQRIVKIDSFPERDNINLRVFESAKMSVCIFLSQNTSISKYSFLLNIWEDRYMTKSKNANLVNTEVLSFDQECATIPSIDNQEMLILRKFSIFPKMVESAYCYQGEINLTKHNDYLHKTPHGRAPVIKGAAIQKWHLREKMSQGENVYLNEKKYLRDNKGNKSHHHKVDRLVTQGITGVDEIYRLKATYLSKGVYCAHSVNYILIKNENIKYQYLLALINSWLLNWFFKKFSTNSNVNSYEVNNLPIPQISENQQRPFIKVVDRILSLTQSVDYQQNHTKQTQVHDYEKQIDRMVYELYGLSPEEIAIVEQNVRR